MAATTAINTPERSGQVRSLPIAAATALFAGTLLATDAAGRLVNASDTAGLRVAGRCEADADNSAGLADALNGSVKHGVFKFANSAANAIDPDDIGKVCFVEDNQTVAETSTHKVKAGRVVALDDDGDSVWVDTNQAARVPGASAVTSVQNATAAASDLATSEALANALKANYNALQLDFTTLITALQAQGIVL